MQRITATLPDNLVDELESLTKVIGCSRSSLMSLMLSEQMPLLSSLASKINETPSTLITYKRAKGESLKLIEERYREILDGFEMY